MLTPGSQQANHQINKGANLRSILLLITGLRKVCRVVGDSMLPTLKTGDLVIYKPIYTNTYSPSQGSIVVATDPLKEKTLIIKRVHKKNSLGIDLRGDNEVNSIDSRKFGLVHQRNIRGVVERIISISS